MDATFADVRMTKRDVEGNEGSADRNSFDADRPSFVVDRSEIVAEGAGGEQDFTVSSPMQQKAFHTFRLLFR